MLVFIRKLSLSTLRWVPICQGFSHFSGFSHHFVSAKLATTSIRVKESSFSSKTILDYKKEGKSEPYNAKIAFGIGDDVKASPPNPPTTLII